ncbi:MAG: zinc-ribbon domain containing protein [Chloracidobacterium sp.]|nr:zinc-ribbon domain containing protein [Chloracidobacterium sp.]
MSDIEDQGAASVRSSADEDTDLQDISIICIDCSLAFIWNAGEQLFFRQKLLTHPPKRCKPCKKAKNRRLRAVEIARTTGKRPRIEVAAECALCGDATTVPFFPSQGRPVYCRKCFLEIDTERAAAAAG